MKAIIMAGGEGKRLRPITDKIPKPLLPIGNAPTIVRILSFLRLHGISEAAITVGYLADKITDALGESCEGVDLTYFKEDTPLGTAGGVKQAESYIGNDDFIVISGDAICETDLSSAIEARRRLDAIALMVLTHCPEPGEYGVVLTDDNGCVSGFCEKPSLSSTFSDSINTGIYVMSPRIFSYIPNGKSDFSKDIFPKLLQSGEKIATYADKNYWCDIGDFASYRNANLRYCKEKNAVSRGCILPHEGMISSVIFDNVKIGKRTKADSAIICSDTVIGDDCIIYRGCVIGYGCTIGNGSVISEGTVIPSGTVIPEGSLIKSNLSLSQSDLREMINGGILRAELRTMSPSFCIRLGSAVTVSTNIGRIGIMTDGKSESGRILSGIVRGIGELGGEVVILGEGFEAAASYACTELRLNTSLFIRVGDGRAKISFYDCDGLSPKRDFERSLISALTSTVSKSNEITNRLISRIDFLSEIYIPMVQSNRCPLEGLKVTVKRENEASKALKEALGAIGADICDDGIKLSVSDDGYSLSAEQEGFVCDDWHIKALLLRYLIREKVSLPASVPSIVKDLCHKTPYLYTHCPSGSGEDEARKNASAFPELIHACAAAAELLALVSVSKRGLRELCSHLPSFALSTCVLRIRDKRRFSILTSIGSPSGDGVLSEYERGSVRIIPRRDGYTLISEAASSEHAEELISLSEREILSLLRRTDG